MKIAPKFIWCYFLFLLVSTSRYLFFSLFYTSFRPQSFKDTPVCESYHQKRRFSSYSMAHSILGGAQNSCLSPLKNVIMPHQKTWFDCILTKVQTCTKCFSMYQWSNNVVQTFFDHLKSFTFSENEPMPSVRLDWAYL